MAEVEYQNRQNPAIFRWPELIAIFRNLVEPVVVSHANLPRQLRNELFTMTSIAGGDRIEY